jgi:hypothetical protein
VKEIQFKLGECGKDFLKKHDQFIELILMNLEIPNGVIYSTPCASLDSKKEDCKDYTFDSLCGLLIREYEKLLNEGKL